MLHELTDKRQKKLKAMLKRMKSAEAALESLADAAFPRSLPEAEKLFRDTRIGTELVQEVLSEMWDALDEVTGMTVAMEDEWYDPACPLCGEKEEVRTSVDGEGRHYCTGA